MSTIRGTLQWHGRVRHRRHLPTARRVRVHPIEGTSSINQRFPSVLSYNPTVFC